MITKYTSRFYSFLYHLLNYRFYNKLSIRSVINIGVRVQGKKYVSIGKRATIQRFGWLLALKIDNNNAPNLVIGDGCAIGDYCHITCVRNVIIENDVLIANGVYISDNNHSYQNVNIPIKHQPIVFKADVVIGAGSWIGEHVCIIGAKIGKNCVIGANTVITKNIPDYCVVVGNPAKIIMKYSNQTGLYERIT
jgi:acetyltransferase-like isoleucine patch superfamily enzyme